MCTIFHKKKNQFPSCGVVRRRRLRRYGSRPRRFANNVCVYYIGACVFTLGVENNAVCMHSDTAAMGVVCFR